MNVPVQDTNLYETRMESTKTDENSVKIISSHSLDTTETRNLIQTKILEIHDGGQCC